MNKCTMKSNSKLSLSFNIEIRIYKTNESISECNNVTSDTKTKTKKKYLYIKQRKYERNATCSSDKNTLNVRRFICFGRLLTMFSFLCVAFQYQQSLFGLAFISLYIVLTQ